jgi:Zn-finger nucleic acid-binding protein
MYRQAQITCPRCATELVAVTTPQITRHTCRGCGGVWIDDDDLRRVLEELSLDPRAPIGPLELVAGPLRCPRCREAMAVERTRGPEPIAQVDVCPDHGAWFDRGEMALALQQLQIERIDKERGPYYKQRADDLIFIWLYELFRRKDPAEPPRTRGRTA